MNFPIHHTFLEVLFRYCSTDKIYITSSDISKLSQLMGKEYIDLVYMVENIERDDNSTKFFDFFLTLKVNAKKLRANTGEELSKNENWLELTGIINTHIATFEKEELKLKEEAEKQKAIDKEKLALKVKERFRLIEQEQAKEKAHYFKRFCDFPEFGRKGIKIGSYAAEILIRIQNDDANEKDFFWLEEKGFMTDQIREAFYVFYLKRGRIHLAEWKKNKKPWSLVNAIADFRKSKSSQDILAVIKSDYPFKFSNGNKKLNSALLTTSGGVYRDLSQYTESLKLGAEANSLTPDDYRPCTLIGASNMLLGNISEGLSWYEKAIERGYKPESYDNEIRSIYMRSNGQIRKELKSGLLAKGYSYSWFRS